MDGIPSAAQAVCLQLGLIAQCQGESAHGFPVRRCQATLNSTDGGLRRSGAPRKDTLAEAELLAMLADQCSRQADIEKYISCRQRDP
jgi:hypothetical protein